MKIVVFDCLVVCGSGDDVLCEDFYCFCEACFVVIFLCVE